MYEKFVAKRLFVSILVWAMVFGFILVDAANAVPKLGLKLPFQLADAAAQPEKDLLTQLETEILPQIESIFNIEQRERFQASIVDGMSFRKAFKSLMLTPEQKKQVKTVLNSTTKKDALASLTPDQKRQLFLKKKAAFRPTTEDIAERIETSLKGRGLELPEGVKEKIDAGLKQKDSFIPSVKAITEKIEAGMSAFKNQLKD